MFLVNSCIIAAKVKFNCNGKSQWPIIIAIKAQLQSKKTITGTLQLLLITNYIITIVANCAQASYWGYLQRQPS